MRRGVVVTELQRPLAEESLLDEEEELRLVEGVAENDGVLDAPPKTSDKDHLLLLLCTVVIPLCRRILLLRRVHLLLRRHLLPRPVTPKSAVVRDVRREEGGHKSDEDLVDLLVQGSANEWNWPPWWLHLRILEGQFLLL